MKPIVLSFSTKFVYIFLFFFFFQAEDGIRDLYVTGVQTCALPIYAHALHQHRIFGLYVPVFMLATLALQKLACRNEGANGWRYGYWSLLVATVARSEEHTSELQSRRDLVCRLLLEKKKKKKEKKMEPQRRLESRRLIDELTAREPYCRLQRQQRRIGYRLMRSCACQQDV